MGADRLLWLQSSICALFGRRHSTSILSMLFSKIARRQRGPRHALSGKDRILGDWAVKGSNMKTVLP